MSFLDNKRTFLEVFGDVVERLDPIFFSDPMTAVIKAVLADTLAVGRQPASKLAKGMENA
jgi:hypothetical protein